LINVGLLAIGDELCIGTILNTNGQFLAQQLTGLGLQVDKHIVCRDSNQEIINALNNLKLSSDIIISTGGLGPTSDDITMPAICDFFNDTLRLDKPSLERITQFFAKRNYALSERNKLQARVPSKSIALNNTAGVVPGIYVNEDSKHYFFLPGVSSEMKAIFEEEILQILNEISVSRQSKKIFYKFIKTIGIPESMLADKVDDKKLCKIEGLKLAFLPSSGSVTIRLGTLANNIEQAESFLAPIISDISEKIGPNIYSYDNISLTEAIAEKLKSKGLTVATAESCTAGMLSAELTSLAGSSKYFIGGFLTYSNESKIEQLSVNPETISNFGAVSRETALEMAENCRKKLNTDIGIAITGIAGPGGATGDKPVGTIWIAISSNEKAIAKHYIFGRDRHQNRIYSVNYALYNLYELINE